MDLSDALPPARAWLSEHRVVDAARLADQLAIRTLHRLRGRRRLDGLFVVASERRPRVALAIVATGLVAVTRRSVRPVISSLTAAAAAQLIAETAKRPVQRRRPPQSNPTIAALSRLPASTSFPSSHAATAFAVARALAPFAPRARPVLYGAAGTIALSRAWLGVHYLSDVAAGALVGAACAGVAAKVVRA